MEKCNKKTIAMAIGLVFVLGFTLVVGCTQTQAKSTTAETQITSGDEAKTSATEVETSKSSSSAAAEPVTLSFLNLNPESGPAVNEIVADFMAENPNIIIKHEYMNSRQYDQKIQNLAAAKNLPDILTVQMFTQYRQMAKEGLLMDLRDTDIIKSGRFLDSALTALKLEDGNVFGTTWDMMGVGAFYNIDMFDKAGLSIPKTWDEFVNVCETFKAKGITPIISALGDDWTSMYIVQSLVTNIAYANNPNYDADFVSGKEKFNSESWIKTFEIIKGIYDKGYFGDNPMGGKYEQSLADFANGKAAMQIIGNWVIPVYREDNPNLKLGFFPVPFTQYTNDLHAVFESELGMGIAANSKYKTEALKFFDYFYSKKPYEKFLMGKKSFTALNDVSVPFDDSAKYMTENYVSTGKMYPYISRQWPIGEDLLMYKMFQEIMLGSKTTDAALNEMDKYYAENK